MTRQRKQVLFWGVLEIVILIYAVWSIAQPVWQNNHSNLFVLGSFLKALGLVLLSIGPAVIWRRIARQSPKS